MLFPALLLQSPAFLCEFNAHTQTVLPARLIDEPAARSGLTSATAPDADEP